MLRLAWWRRKTLSQSNENSPCCAESMVSALGTWTVASKSRHIKRVMCTREKGKHKSWSLTVIRSLLRKERICVPVVRCATLPNAPSYRQGLSLPNPNANVATPMQCQVFFRGTNATWIENMELLLQNGTNVRKKTWCSCNRKLYPKLEASLLTFLLCLWTCLYHS